MIAAHWHFPTMFLVAGLPAVIGAVAILAIRAARQAQPQASSARA
jgi:hypothetical protein